MRPNLAFKTGISVFLLAGISMLWGFIYVAYGEYDPSHIETSGIVMVILSAAVGSGALVWNLYQLLKWKPA